MKFFYGILLLVSLLAFSSCNKEEIWIRESNTVLITKQPWKLTAYSIVRLSDGTVQDGFAPITTCYRDDQYVFKPDNTYEGNAGVTKCDTGDPQVFQSGTWKFTQNETLLERTITAGTSIGTFTFKINSLTATTLKISVEDGGLSHDITYNH